MSTKISIQFDQAAIEAFNMIQDNKIITFTLKTLDRTNGHYATNKIEL